MISGNAWSLRFPDICRTAEENPVKTSTRKTDLTGDRTRYLLENGITEEGGFVVTLGTLILKDSGSIAGLTNLCIFL